MMRTKTCFIPNIGNFVIPENEPCDVWVNWERPIMEYVLRNIRPDIYFIDVGANIGYFSVWVATKVDTVFCIEPNPNVYEILEVNSRLSNNIKTFNMALSGIGKIGIGQIYYRDLANGDGRLYDPREGNPEDRNAYETKNIPVETLSSFQEKYCSGHSIDFIKMDCEGSEYDILQDLDFFRNEKNKNCEVVLELHGPMIEMRGLDFNKFVDYLLSNFEIKDLNGNKCNDNRDISPRGHISLSYSG